MAEFGAFAVGNAEAKSRIAAHVLNGSTDEKTEGFRQWRVVDGRLKRILLRGKPGIAAVKRRRRTSMLGLVNPMAFRQGKILRKKYEA